MVSKKAGMDSTRKSIALRKRQCIDFNRELDEYQEDYETMRRRVLELERQVAAFQDPFQSAAYEITEGSSFIQSSVIFEKSGRSSELA
jgi:uncharacterized protein YlxW (UPF0749 family)